jgi:hypothetical protein
MSGLKVSVADIRLSLLNTNEGAAQHTASTLNYILVVFQNVGILYLDTL